MPVESGHPEANTELKSIEEIATPNIQSISQLAQFLKVQDKDLVKILFFISNDTTGEQLDNHSDNPDNFDKPSQNKADEQSG